MNPTISTEAVLDALSALQEARQYLGNKRENDRLALKIAAAEGRLRGALINAVPDLELRSAA